MLLQVYECILNVKYYTLDIFLKELSDNKRRSVIVVLDLLLHEILKVIAASFHVTIIAMKF